MKRWDTVDEMLECFTPDEWVEIVAARETVPFTDGWRQAGTVSATIHNEFERYCAGKAGKTRVDESRWHLPTKYIPTFTPPRKRTTVNQASIDLTQRIIESQFIR